MAYRSDAAAPRWLLVATLGCALAACFVASENADGGIDDDYMDDDPPPDGCDTEDCNEPGSDGNPVGGPCNDSTDCEGSAICAADFSEGEVDSFTCQASCVPTMDESQWCIDDTSCCDAGSVCSPRGFCLPPPDDSGGLDDSGDSGSGTSGGADSGTGEAGSSSGTTGGDDSSGTSSDGSSSGG